MEGIPKNFSLKRYYQGILMVIPVFILTLVGFLFFFETRILREPLGLFMRQHPQLTGLVAVEIHSSTPMLSWYRLWDGRQQTFTGEFAYRFTRSDEALVLDRYSTSSDAQKIFLINPLKVNKLSVSGMPGIVKDAMPSPNGLFVVLTGTSTRGVFTCVSKRNVANFKDSCKFLSSYPDLFLNGGNVEHVQWDLTRQAELQILTHSATTDTWWLYYPSTQKIMRATTTIPLEMYNHTVNEENHLSVRRYGILVKVSEDQSNKNTWIVLPKQAEIVPMQRNFLLIVDQNNMYIVDPFTRKKAFISEIPGATSRKITVW